MNLILFGPPGAGKGTQAQFIVKKYNYFQLSTGDLLRNEIKKNTLLGKEIENIITPGEFVSDTIVNALLKQAITKPEIKNKIIFDGYPRNITQAENLKKMLKDDNQTISKIIYLKVSRDIIKKRILGRLSCEKCNITLNEFFNSDEIINHSCGKQYLKKRKDDNPQTVITRYDNYMEKTQPILDFYSYDKGFHEVDGSQKIEVITRKIDEILEV